MYKHLFFDLDNTIWDFDRNARHAMEEVYLEYGLPSEDYNHFYEIFEGHNTLLWDFYRKNEITKAELAEQRFSKTFDETGISGIDALTFNDRYLERMPFQTKLCDGAFDVLQRLSQRFVLHIVTNGFVEVQYKKLDNSNIRQFFQNIFISEEVKSPKPEREIFMHALKYSNARKRESLMIGDSWEVDILGAMAAGIDQVYYAPDNKSNEINSAQADLITSSSTQTYRILHLNEILGIVGIF